MVSRSFLIALCAILVSLPLASATKKTVSFAEEAEVLEFDKPVGILKKPGSTSPSKSSNSTGKERRASVFDSDDETDDLDALFSRPAPTLKTEKSSSSSRPSSSSLSTTSSRSQPSRRESPPSRQVAKKPTTGLSRFKNSGPIANPIINVILAVIDAFVDAYNEGRSNEFISDEAELDALHRRQGIASRRKDPTEMLFRIGRPSGWLALHMLTFYSFPYQPMLWGGMLILDLLIILFWRQHDLEWMLEEMGHWDYLFGLGVFAATGVVSLVHQGISFLSKVFFALAPGLVLVFYILVLLYAAFKKPHHYYY